MHKMIRESYTILEASQNAGTTILKLTLDIISAYPYIIILTMLVLIGLSVLIILILLAILAKWVYKTAHSKHLLS